MIKELKNKLKVSDDASGWVMERDWGLPTWPPHCMIYGPKKLARL